MKMVTFQMPYLQCGRSNPKKNLLNDNDVPSITKCGFLIPLDTQIVAPCAQCAKAAPYVPTMCPLIFLSYKPVCAAKKPPLYKPICAVKEKSVKWLPPSTQNN